MPAGWSDFCYEGNWQHVQSARITQPTETRICPVVDVIPAIDSLDPPSIRLNFPIPPKALRTRRKPSAKVRIARQRRGLDIAGADIGVGQEAHVKATLQLLDHVWGGSVYVEERTIDVHIRRLRKTLEPFNAENMVQTVRGAGYRFSTAT